MCFDIIQKKYKNVPTYENKEWSENLKIKNLYSPYLW